MVKDWYEAYADAAIILHPDWDHTMDLTEAEEQWCLMKADQVSDRPECEQWQTT